MSRPDPKPLKARCPKCKRLVIPKRTKKGYACPKCKNIILHSPP